MSDTFEKIHLNKRTADRSTIQLRETIPDLETLLDQKETQLLDLNYQVTMQRTQLESSRLEVSRLENQEAILRKILTEVVGFLGPHLEIFDDEVAEEGNSMLDHQISQSIQQFIRKYETLKTEHTQLLYKLKDTEASNLELAEMVTELMHITKKLIDEYHQPAHTKLVEIPQQIPQLTAFSKMAFLDDFTKED